MASTSTLTLSREPSERELATLDPFHNLKSLLCRLLKQPPPALRFNDTDERPSAFAPVLSGELSIEPWYRRLLRGTSRRGF
jgi:hypothetical protein